MVTTMMMTWENIPHPPLPQSLEGLQRPRKEVRFHVVPRPSPDLEARVYHRRRISPGKLAGSCEAGLPELRQVHRRWIKLRVLLQLGLRFRWNVLVFRLFVFQVFSTAYIRETDHRRWGARDGRRRAGESGRWQLRKQRNVLGCLFCLLLCTTKSLWSFSFL